MGAFCLRLIGLIVMIAALCNVFAQELLIEQLALELQESGSDGESILQELLAQSLDLNNASPAAIRRLPFLEQQQIDSFLAERRKQVFFSNLDDALAAFQVSGDTLRLCRRIFHLTKPREPIEWHVELRTRTSRAAAPDDNWRGPPYRVYNRLAARVGDFQFGMLVERDPGESRLDDYRSQFIQWQRRTAANHWQIIAGNYQIEWAHGLVLWGPYGSSVSSDVHAAARRWGRLIRPYRSSNEHAYLRGGTLSYSSTHLDLLVFASKRSLDARLDDTGRPVSYKTDGLHRTETELSQRNRLGAQVLGGGIKLQLENRFEIGVLYKRSRFDQDWQRRNPDTDHFGFAGRKNELWSVTSAWQHGNLGISFEGARSRSGGKAISAVLGLHERSLSWTASYFHYDPLFHSEHGRSLSGLDDRPQGEQGGQLGLRYKPVSSFTAELFYEKTRSLWQTALLPFPSQRERFGIKAELKTAGRSKLRCRYRSSQRPRLSSGSYLARHVLPRRHESLRLEYEHGVSRSLMLRPRIEFAREHQTKLQSSGSAISGKEIESSRVGTAVALEMIWRPVEALLVNLRQTFYDTPVPIYQYERDLPGVFTVRALRDSGARRYIYLRFKPIQSLALSFKFACTEREFSALRHQSSCAWSLQVDISR